MCRHFDMGYRSCAYTYTPFEGTLKHYFVLRQYAGMLPVNPGYSKYFN